MATILLFGRLGEQFGREVDLDLPSDGCTVGDLRALLVRTLPSADDSLLQRCVSVCIDQQVAWDDHLVQPGQEIAIFPPLSGG